MLVRLLPLLAISGVVASPLRPRQDASVSSATGDATSATSAVASDASAASTATGSAPPASSAPSVNATAAAPSVTIYPDTSNGEPIVVNGAKGVLPGVDTYLGVPFAAPRMSPSKSWNTADK